METLTKILMQTLNRDEKKFQFHWMTPSTPPILDNTTPNRDKNSDADENAEWGFQWRRNRIMEMEASNNGE